MSSNTQCLRASLALLTIGVAAGLAACGSSTASPSFPLIGGQYTTTFQYQLHANTDYDSTFTVPATINMLDADRVGTFTGTILFSVANDTGIVAGEFVQNNAIQFLIFGDGSPAPPLMSAKVFAALFPQCNFKDSLATVTPGAGSISGKTLTYSGVYANFKCGSDSAVSTLNVSVSGTNTTGPM